MSNEIENNKENKETKKKFPEENYQRIELDFIELEKSRHLRKLNRIIGIVFIISYLLILIVLWFLVKKHYM